MRNKKTLVIGASINPSRYSNIAINRLVANNIDVRAIGKSEGQVSSIKILKNKVLFKNIDTITIYLNKKNQEEFYDYILKTNPKRVIFNPGTENIELENLLHKNNIQFESSCTLVLLSIGAY